jgi:hypothetical protein
MHGRYTGAVVEKSDLLIRVRSFARDTSVSSDIFGTFLFFSQTLSTHHATAQFN